MARSWPHLGRSENLVSLACAVRASKGINVPANPRCDMSAGRWPNEILLPAFGSPVYPKLP
jgi:hypothetical protein